ncbi:J-protein co-chaperone of the mitochondrial import motor [Nadsonia fulvescens var. elongata DSM 6958]|uniref:Mitochondrial import inner membrane translocase subunit TIM14 n=1 Tax=Nadsonia fulvescens var. elongata DSM 6958 TaxID=857566 RepID=A0A1E3PFP2_9ASCO|nr:J-protein co-chaperone of the mitochondrial import motor [Nadsonia fulvescens var. elongata DSM 6958]
MSAQPEKSTPEQVFDTISNYVSEHPIISGAGAVATFFILQSIFKKPTAGIGGKAFYKGGFDPKMNAKEALQVLNLKESTLTLTKLKENHRKIMLLNHPDRGGSPYIATKINEAKDFLEKRGGLRK